MINIGSEFLQDFDEFLFFISFLPLSNCGNKLRALASLHQVCQYVINLFVCGIPLSSKLFQSLHIRLRLCETGRARDSERRVWHGKVGSGKSEWMLGSLASRHQTVVIWVDWFRISTPSGGRRVSFDGWNWNFITACRFTILAGGNLVDLAILTG